MSTIEKLKELINNCDALVIGAGAGLSTAAGFIYGGKYFLDNFKYMNDKYGYTDMYSAGFHNFLTEEEKWGYWSKFIYLNRYKYNAMPLYKELFDLVKDKNYFVLTTNVDHQFQLAGFDKKRLFYTQGDYGLFQCKKKCHNKTYDNKDIILEMIDNVKDGYIPKRLVPHCPVCNGYMETNLRKDNLFVEDKGWHEASDRYLDFINQNKDKKILFLELGVGYNTPVIIKYPFMKMTYEFNDAFYVTINQEEAYIPKEIKAKSISISDDIKKVIEEIKK